MQDSLPQEEYIDYQKIYHSICATEAFAFYQKLRDIEQQPPVQDLFESLSEKITRGRSFSEMALDDVINEFVDIMLPTEDKEPFISQLKILLDKRHQIKFSEDEAYQAYEWLSAKREIVQQNLQGLQNIFSKSRVKGNEREAVSFLMSNDETEPYGRILFAEMNKIYRMFSRLNHSSDALRSGWEYDGKNNEIFSLLQQHNASKQLVGGAGNNNTLPLLQKGAGQKQPGQPSCKKDSEAGKILEKYSVNLTAKAAGDNQRPTVGRHEEIQSIIESMGSALNPNALVIGDSGVGKTSVIEGLAQKIAGNSDVLPAHIKGAQIHSLSLGAIVAGTKNRGDFEERLQNIVDILKNDKKSILLIEDIEEIFGAGNASGSLDAASILRPALQNGQIRCIGTTTPKGAKTLADNKDFIRMFGITKVAPPNREQCVEIVKGVAPWLEEFHSVKFSEKAIEAAVKGSERFITDRKSPGSTVKLLDDTAATRKCKAGEECKTTKITVAEIEEKLTQQTGKPVKLGDERKQIAALFNNLQKEIFGQDHALEIVSKAIKRARAPGVRNPYKPMASMLFTGPTGVGKTEVVKRTAELLGMTFQRIDMSEYMEKHTVSRLIGAPPGYLGHDEGGILTDALAYNPYCVLCLDEIEKAHPDVQNILLQIMDYGTVTDSTGQVIDCRNIVLVMTTNANAQVIKSNQLGFGNKDQARRHKEAFSQSAIEARFSPEFRNRLDKIVSFNALTEEVVGFIADKFIGQLADRILEESGSVMEVTPEARQLIMKNGFDPSMGARPMERTVSAQVGDLIADKFIEGELPPGSKILIHHEEGKDCLSLSANGDVGPAKTKIAELRKKRGNNNNSGNMPPSSQQQADDFSLVA